MEYGLNEVIPPQDGDGLYRAEAPLGNPVIPTASGALITTFEFLALAEAPSTTLDILATGGDGGTTVVFDGLVPGLHVTGTLGSATVEITPEPTTLSLLALGGLLVITRRR